MRTSGMCRAVARHPNACPALILRVRRRAAMTNVSKDEGAATDLTFTRVRTNQMRKSGRPDLRAAPHLFVAHGSRRAAYGRAPHHEGVGWGGRRCTACSRGANRLCLWLSLSLVFALSFGALAAARAERAAPTVRSPWWCRSRRAAPTTSWRGRSPTSCGNRSASRWWWKIAAAAPPARSRHGSSRKARPTATRCCSPTRRTSPAAQICSATSATTRARILRPSGWSRPPRRSWWRIRRCPHKTSPS